MDIFSIMLNTKSLEALLLKDEIDIALVEGKVRSDCLIEKPFCSDELVFITSPKFAGISKKEDLKKYDFVTREKGSGTRDLFEQNLLEIGIKPNIITEYNNSSCIIDAVKRNFGIAVLSERLVRNDIQNGFLKTFSLRELSFKRTFRLVIHKDKFITPVIDKLKTICVNGYLDKESENNPRI